MLIIKKIIFYSILLILVVPFVFAAEREITLTNLKVLDASGNPLVDSDGDGDFDIAQNTQFIFKFDMQNTGSVGLGSETQGVIIGLTNSIALEPDVSTRLSFVLPVGSILSNQIIGPLKFESIAGPGIYSFILDSWATYIIVPGDASITPIKIDFPGGANYINLEHKFVGFVTPTGQTREEIWASQNPNKVYGYSVSLKNNNPISDYSGKYYLYTYGSPDYCRIFNAQFTLAPEEEQIFTISLPLCSDGLDNDGDLLTDYSADPGCYDSYDNDETDGANPPAAGPFPECSDRYDNDRDGKIDYPSDPGCTSFDGTNENNDPVTLTLCNDNADNDKDGFFDLDDPGCLDAADNDETDPATPPECADNMDNDGDGRVDNYGYRATKGYYAAANDPACGAAGQTEKNVLEQCSDGIDNDGDGLTDYPADPGCYIKFDALETNLGCPMKEYENHYFDIIGADGVRPFSTAPRYDKYITNANLWYTGPMPPFINDPDLKFSPTDNIEIYSIQRGLMQGIPANSIFHIWAWDKKTRYKLFDQSFIIPSGFFYYGTIPETSPNTLVYGGVTYNSYKYLGNVKFEANMCKLENNYCETNPPDPEHTEVPSQLDLFYEYLLPEPMTNRLGGPNLANPGGYGAMPRNFAVTAVHKCLVKDNNGCGCTSALDTILKILKKSCVMSGSDIIVNRIYSGLFQFSAALEAELNERILKVESKDPAGNIQEITDYILGNSIEFSTTPKISTTENMEYSFSFNCDLDSDGYMGAACNDPVGTIPAGEIDCDDTNPGVYPGAGDICDNLDNNCINGVDESFTDKGTECNVGIGACGNSGFYVCNPAMDGTECSAIPGVSQSEICDTLDNNCDGSADEGCDDDNDGYADSLIICSLSFIDGNGATQSCDTYSNDCDDESAEINPGIMELCDNKDNNCDGSADEIFTNKNEVCSVGMGICVNSGFYVCNPAMDGTECNAVLLDISQNEICDRFDNNCDGNVDEGCACVSEQIQACYTGSSGCINLGGEYICYGICQAGTQTCNINGVWDANCIGEVLPEEEICDTIDNNCDGSIDEGCDDDNDGYADSFIVCSLSFIDGNGATQSCGTNSNDCDDNDASVHPGSLEICNGIDDDCDYGTIDGRNEVWYDQSTTCGQGICTGNTGLYICSNGVQIDTCNPLTEAIAENCDIETGYDGLDNNCDGQIDLNCDSYCDQDIDSYTPHLICLLSLKYPIKLDCNDNNALINPGATDVCGNGVVENCVADSACCECSGTECNPNVIGGQCDGCNYADVSGMSEICNSIDDNCDKNIDEGIGTTICGLGACQNRIVNCLNGEIQECTPLDSNPELCNDLIDNDCDGFTDEFDPDCAFVPLSECQDADGDGFTDTVCGGDDCDDNDPDVNPGMLEMCDGKDNDCDGITDALADTHGLGFIPPEEGGEITMTEGITWWPILLCNGCSVEDATLATTCITEVEGICQDRINTLTLLLTDASGLPIPNINVCAGSCDGDVIGSDITFDSLYKTTDTNGRVTFNYMVNNVGEYLVTFTTPSKDVNGNPVISVVSDPISFSSR